MRKLYDTFRSLKDRPGRDRPESEEGTREILFPPLPYVAVYRIREQTVEVLRFLTAHRIGPRLSPHFLESMQTGTPISLHLHTDEPAGVVK